MKWYLSQNYVVTQGKWEGANDRIRSQEIHDGREPHSACWRNFIPIAYSGSIKFLAFLHLIIKVCDKKTFDT